ncbi:hypothetical protein ACFWVT_07350 [Streptomyces cyaneofuscatus]|uniref:hypothetical protein n=1 Tax=Streptomyces cyaneofuscatus TaxID=66883 RepID=UPI003663F591
MTDAIRTAPRVQLTDPGEAGDLEADARTVFGSEQHDTVLDVRSRITTDLVRDAVTAAAGLPVSVRTTADPYALRRQVRRRPRRPRRGDGRPHGHRSGPRLAGTRLVFAALQVATAIMAEAALSFPGLSVQPPQPSLGAIVAGGTDHLAARWSPSVFPGLAILLTAAAFNVFADALRDALDAHRPDLAPAR